jgi:hypothetical protein
MRDIVDAIGYLTHNGPVWRALPPDFRSAGTVYWWADKWQAGPGGGDHRFPVGPGRGHRSRARPVRGGGVARTVVSDVLKRRGG